MARKRARKPVKRKTVAKKKPVKRKGRKKGGGISGGRGPLSKTASYHRSFGSARVVPRRDWARKPLGGSFKGVRRSGIALRRHKSRGGAFWLPLIGAAAAIGSSFIK